MKKSLLSIALAAAAAPLAAQTLDLQSGAYAQGFYAGSLEYREDGFLLLSEPDTFGPNPADSLRDAWTHDSAGIASYRGSAESSFSLVREDGGQFREFSIGGYTGASDACGPLGGPGGTTATVTGSLNGEQRFSYVAVFSCSAREMSNPFALLDVDELIVRTGGLNFEHVTDLQLASPAPEPETWAFMALGLACVARRRRAAWSK